jgi:ATP-dependent RNA helicase DDX41
MAVSTSKRPLDYSYDYDEEDDATTPSAGQVYVPLKKRREEQLKKLARGGSSSRGGTPGGSDSAGAAQEEEVEDPEEIAEREKAQKRLERTLLAEAQEVHKQKAIEGG